MMTMMARSWLTAWSMVDGGEMHIVLLTWRLMMAPKFLSNFDEYGEDSSPKI
jgi:hypothetical protein